jgi:hypothetical protein
VSQRTKVIERLVGVDRVAGVFGHDVGCEPLDRVGMTQVWLEIRCHRPGEFGFGHVAVGGEVVPLAIVTGHTENGGERR